MRIIHGVNFEPELKKEYQYVIYQNVIRGMIRMIGFIKLIDSKKNLQFPLIAGMQVLIDAREKLEIPWGNNDREKDSSETKLMECTSIDAEKFIQYAAVIGRLWQDRGIRRAYERRREFQIVCISVFY